MYVWASRRATLAGAERAPSPPPPPASAAPALRRLPLPPQRRRPRRLAAASDTLGILCELLRSLRRRAAASSATVRQQPCDAATSCSGGTRAHRGTSCGTWRGRYVSDSRCCGYARVPLLRSGPAGRTKRAEPARRSTKKVESVEGWRAPLARREQRLKFSVLCLPLHLWLAACGGGARGTAICYRYASSAAAAAVAARVRSADAASAWAATQCARLLDAARAAALQRRSYGALQCRLVALLHLLAAVRHERLAVLVALRHLRRHVASCSGRSWLLDRASAAGRPPAGGAQSVAAKLTRVSPPRAVPHANAATAAAAAATARCSARRR